MEQQYTRKKLDFNVESRILIGSIVSTKFLQQLIPLSKLEFFSSNYAKTVFSWIVEYYQLYKEAPKTAITML
jgi:hypothetical protein